MRKSEKLFDAITDVRDDVLHRADARYASMRVPVWKRRWVRSVAALLVVAILGGILLQPDTRSGSPLALSAYAVAAADYPKMAPYPGNNGNYDAWRKDIQAQRGPKGYADGLDGFFAQTIQAFLSKADGENVVYSPLNVYMALAMLAEITDGESRGQILDLLDHEDMKTLREQASILWNANYRDDGATTSVLASSVWLNETVEFHKDTLRSLADTYYASSYQGEMGSDEFDVALQTWLNDQTGGLLEKQVSGRKMSEETILALATTVYFRAKWDYRFSEEKTTQEVFHAVNGDVTVDFMHHSENEKYYYWGEHFSAVNQRLENAEGMWFILPDKDVTAEDLLNDEETMAFLLSNGQDWENSKFLKVNESIPKFDVASQLDMVEELQQLGVTEVFDSTNADFSPVTDFTPVWLGEAEHVARVAIDEEGVEATAYTVMVAVGDPPPPDEVVDFVVDRPFLFVLTGIDGLPLFVGMVNNP